MAKICAKGKAAAKRKFDVYPSAYANMYASKICKGQIKGANKGEFIDVMGSPISVDVAGETLSNPSAAAYYKGLLD
jgi:hypothetical protein|tara:strand:+ start:190 stop:417 length:228 start_codon:yes stop_codon:yes gene_type:complete